MKHFSISELTSSATALREGIDNRPSKCAYHLLHVLVEQLLDPIREAWGEPIVVSSGYRCKELNTLIGGVKNSHHILGCAADIIGGLPLNSQARLLNEAEASAGATDAPLASARRGGTSESAGNESESHNVKTNKTLFDFIVKMQQSGQIRFTQLIWGGAKGAPLATTEDLSSQRSAACGSDGRWIHISYVPGDLRCQVIE